MTMLLLNEEIKAERSVATKFDSSIKAG